jgi:hypothetical protein
MCSRKCLLSFQNSHLPYCLCFGIGLANLSSTSAVVNDDGGFMTKGQWLLVGAVLVGLAVGLYLLFFCPTECH